MRAAKLILTIVLCPVIGCGGGGGDGGTNPPPPPTVASVSLSRSSAMLKPSESVTITATAKDASGGTISGRTVTWNNSAPSIVSLAANGASATVTGTVLGSSNISATVDQVTSPQASITVTNNFPNTASISVGASGNTFDPSQADMGAGGTVTFTWGNSGTTHNVTWINPPASVSGSGDKSSGSFSVTLNTSGTYNYHCTFHAGMDGSITVH